MRILTKISVTFGIILFILFFAFPIADEVGWSITKSLWADRSEVNVAAAGAGTIVGMVLYGLMLLFCMWLTIKVWSGKKVPDRAEATNLEASFADKNSDNNRDLFTSHPTNQFPETKSCPFCAEEVKFLAIKFKLCLSDISQR